MTSDGTAPLARIGVVGCGLMGSGIAEVCARAGVPVVVAEAEYGGAFPAAVRHQNLFAPQFHLAKSRPARPELRRVPPPPPAACPRSPRGPSPRLPAPGPRGRRPRAGTLAVR